MSLKTNKAKLAEEHNMEETRFMQEFPIMLPEDPDVFGRLKRTCLEDNDGNIFYQEVYNQISFLG